MCWPGGVVEALKECWERDWHFLFNYECIYAFDSTKNTNVVYKTHPTRCLSSTVNTKTGKMLTVDWMLLFPSNFPLKNRSDYYGILLHCEGIRISSTSLTK